MDLVDVIFPQKLGRLTYSVPDDMRGLLKPGIMIEADVRKSMRRGIVVGPSTSRLPAKAKIKDISAILHDQPSLTPALVELLSWVSKYYFSREGLTLKAALPSEFFEPVRARGTGKVREPQSPYSSVDAPDKRLLSALEKFAFTARDKKYHAFLHHAASQREEMEFLLHAIRGRKNIIILAPDKSALDHLLPELRMMLGERLVELHSSLSKGQRSDALRRCASGLGDVVIGSHSAVFAPLPSVSLIAVLSENSTLYKAEGMPRYHVRDTAVMRAYLEGGSVLLSSICPTLESWHNAATGKYTLLDTATKAPRPKVRLINAWGQERAVSPKVVASVDKALKSGGRALLYVNRKGYAMLRCEECGHLGRCPKCDIPLILNKGEQVLSCGYCGHGEKPFDICPECNSAKVALTGMGMERIEDELREMLPVSVDSLRRENLSMIFDEGAGLGIGTQTLTRTAALSGTARVAAVLNADALLALPDFRSRERAFEDMIYAADMAEPGGELFIQTRFANLPMFSQIKKFDFSRFYKSELKDRQEALYPPYSRLAMLDVRTQREPSIDLSHLGEVEALGPVPVRLKPLKGRTVSAWRYMLKASSRDALHEAVKKCLTALKPARVDVDIDPTGF